MTRRGARRLASEIERFVVGEWSGTTTVLTAMAAGGMERRRREYICRRGVAQLKVGVRCCVVGDRGAEEAVEVRRQCWSGILVGIVDGSVCPRAKVVAVPSQSWLKGVRRLKAARHRKALTGYRRAVHSLEHKSLTKGRG